MAKVIAKFKDKDGKVYEKGDKYEGTKKRIEELSTDKNKYKRLFLKVEEEKKASAKKSEKDKK